MDVHSIASSGIPILCIDTCSILDIMRDPTRTTARPHDHRAALGIVAAIEAGRLICLVADQVATEFAAHDKGIQEEAERNLKNLRDQIMNVNELSEVYGSLGTIQLAHLDDHVARARAVVGRLLSRVEAVKPSAIVPTNAFVRVNRNIAPARQGKESSKDCLIYETYLEAIGNLRTAGALQTIVFLSSNTNDYQTVGNILKPDIAAELDPLNCTYAPNISVAKRALGL
jgi:hypothetical protein